MSKGGIIQYLNGLGLVAKTVRKIQNGKYYDKYFPSATKTDPILHKDGEVKDTVEYCKKIVNSTLSDTKQLAPLLRRTSLQLTLIEVFAFVYNYIQYEIDKPNVEQIRRPARTWSDRKGDCDCMSVFVSSVLTNLNIPHSFRIVKMYGRNFYQHIYVIVPKPGKTDMSKRDNYYVIDPVLDRFNEEAPKINFKTDFKMKNLAGIPIQFLNGMGSHQQNIDIPSLGKEFDDFEGLNGTDEEIGNAYNARMKRHLINTHSVITNNPGRVSQLYNPTALAAAYKDLINNWDSENAREGALDRLSATEESFLRPELQGLGDIIHGDDNEIFGLLNGDFSNAGLAGKKAAARKSATGSSKPATQKKGVFTKIKTANKFVKQTVQAEKRKVGAGVKKASANTKKTFKKVGKKVVKATTTPIRVGILAAMKVNFGKLGSRMYWGMFSKSEAMQYGVLPEWWNASNNLFNKLRTIFVQKLSGDEKVLRKSIITGRAAKVAKRGTTMRGLGNANELFTNGLAELSGYSGGIGAIDPATATAITAAASVLTPLIAMASKSFAGKKVSAKSRPDDGSQTDDGSDEPEVENEAENVSDNYQNEVVDEQIEGVEDLGKPTKKNAPLKSSPKTATAKRITKEREVKKVTKSATKKAANTIKDPKKLQAAITDSANAVAKAKDLKKKLAVKHAANAKTNKKIPFKTLVVKLKNNPAYKNLTAAQIEAEAIKLQNKTPLQIEKEAQVFAEVKVTEKEGPKTIYTDPSGNQYDTKEKYEAAIKTSTPKAPTDAMVDNDNGSNSAAEGGQDPKKPIEEKEEEVKEGMGMATKVTIGVIGLAAIVLIAKSGKKKASVSGLNGFTEKKRHKNVYELNKAEAKLKKALTKKGVKLPHGYDLKNRKVLNGTKVRTIKIK